MSQTLREENEALRLENAKLTDEVRRLRTLVEGLYAERTSSQRSSHDSDVLQLEQKLEEALCDRDNLREEMGAAMRVQHEDYCDALRRQCDENAAVRLELRKVLDRFMETVWGEEAGARLTIIKEEEEQSIHAVFCALRRDYLGVPITKANQRPDFCAPGKGLYELWQKVRGHEMFSPAFSQMLLKEETHLTKLFFNVSGGGPKWAFAFSVPLHHLNSFIHDMVVHLPALQHFGLRALPSLEQYCLPWINDLSSSVEILELPDSLYNAVDLTAIHRTRPCIVRLAVNREMCDQWGPYEEYESHERKTRIEADCDNVLHWIMDTWLIS